MWNPGTIVLPDSPPSPSAPRMELVANVFLPCCKTVAKTLLQPQHLFVEFQKNVHLAAAQKSCYSKTAQAACDFHETLQSEIALGGQAQAIEERIKSQSWLTGIFLKRIVTSTNLKCDEEEFSSQDGDTNTHDGWIMSQKDFEIMLLEISLVNIRGLVRLILLKIL